MRLKDFGKNSYLLAAMLLAPGISLATSPRMCTAGEPTPASHTWNFSQKATNLLDGMRADARQVQYHADRVQSFEHVRDPDIDWHVHALQLMAIRHSVNDMAAKLCGLEEVKQLVEPWQQKAIDSNAALVRLMADNIEDAINYVNSHQGYLWNPTYERYAANLYEESGQLSNSVKEYTQYAKLRARETNLQKTLGMKTGS